MFSTACSNKLFFSICSLKELKFFSSKFNFISLDISSFFMKYSLLKLGTIVYFKEKRIKGEWFELNDEDLEKFKPMCEQLHENFNIIERSNTYYIDRGERF